jgi:hypothetical protein
MHKQLQQSSLEDDGFLARMKQERLDRNYKKSIAYQMNPVDPEFKTYTFEQF